MEKQHANLSNGGKVKLLCSYGGRIWSRPTDRQLSYIGGDTKILAVDRTTNFSDMVEKLNSICSRSDTCEISIKYQLPGEDLDSLVSLIDDDDVEHMMVEYERLQRISSKPARLRLFIFDASGRAPAKQDSAPVMHPNPDYLFGFDKEYQPSIGPPLDLLQIPGMTLPENCGIITRGAVEGSNGIGDCHVASEPAVYRLPTMGVGAFQTGAYSFGGNEEQPVYNVVPVMPPGHRPEV